MGRLHLDSCYARPSLSSADYERLLEMIESSVMPYRGVCITVIVAGDFKAHSSVWVDRHTDNRGASLCALGNSLGLVVSNRGRVPAFFARGRRSIVDTMMVSKSASERLRNWRVLTDYENLSDHHHITFLLWDRVPDPSSSITSEV